MKKKRKNEKTKKKLKNGKKKTKNIFPKRKNKNWKKLFFKQNEGNPYPQLRGLRYSYEWKQGQSPTPRDGKINQLQVGKLCTKKVVPGVVVGTCPRSDANGASGDGPPTASADRERGIPDWLNTVHERTGWKENLDQQAVLLKRFAKHLLHLFQGDPRTNLEGITIYLLIFPNDPNCE